MCKRWKEVERFYKNKGNPDGIQNGCIDCQESYKLLWQRANKDKTSEYKKKYRRKHPGEELEQTRRYQNKTREWFYLHKSKLHCENCDEKHPAALDFHHIDPNRKKNEITQMVFKGVSEKTIISEIKKCCVLCSNCHRKLHWEMKHKNGENR